MKKITAETIEDIIADIKLITSRNQIGAVLNKYYDNGIYVELGVFDGSFLKFLVKNTNPRKIYGVDIWDNIPEILETTNHSKEHLNSLYLDLLDYKSDKPQLELIKDYTFNAASKFKDRSIDFVYIDADHSYEGVKRDLNLWFDKVKIGGIISGHDYFEFKSSYQFGIIQAVDEFIKEKKIINFHPSTDYPPSWFIVKE